MLRRLVIRPGQVPALEEITDQAKLDEIAARDAAHAARVAERRNDERTLTRRQLFQKRLRQQLQDDPGEYKNEIRTEARRLMAADPALSRQQALSTAIDTIIEDEWRERGS